MSKSYGPEILFSDLSIGFFENERLGLIGPNGSGKSTLLKILTGLVSPSSGKVSRRRNVSLQYLSQADQLDPEKTIMETLFQSKPDLTENWESDRNIREIIKEMAFENLGQTVETLSGGWQKRVAISQALIAKPDLFLMDEPTNHLDLEGILWLEKRLIKAHFAFVLVSHDRTFLENTCNRIVELNPSYPAGFIKIEGNYSTFLKKRAEISNEQIRHEESLASRVRREVEWLQRGPKARTTKARYRINQAASLQNDLKIIKTRITRNQTAQIDFNATDRKTKKLLETKALEMRRSGKLLFQNLNITLSPGFCLGCLGKNGSGKSSLIDLLNGTLQPDSGLIKKADGLKMVTFGQKREALDQNQTLKEALSPEGGDQVVYQDRPVHIVSWAKRFLFTPQQLGLPVSKLSGGEQARLLIANLMLKPADILLLDEPTNDLDIPTLGILEESLQEFPGAIFLITHDRYLLNRLSHQILALEAHGEAAFYADIGQWLEAQKSRPSVEVPTQKPAKSPVKQPSETAWKLTYEERKELSRIEKKIEKATEEVEALKQQLNAPAVQSNSEQLLTLSAVLEAAEKKVDVLYLRWEKLETLR